MFYRVQAYLYFTNEDEANDFYHDCETAILKSQTINPGQSNAEHGTITLHVCNHDESQSIPCEILESSHTP